PTLLKAAALTTNGTTADADGIADHAGEVINYTITVTNTGNIDLTNPVLSDTLGGLGALDGALVKSGDSVDPGVLNVGEVWTYTGSHTVTQGDLDNKGAVDGAGDGQIENSASIVTDQASAGPS